jgi:hypothetical protein
MLPLDLLRQISGYLHVRYAVRFDSIFKDKLFAKQHYKRLLETEDYHKRYNFRQRVISIGSYYLSNTVFSLVRSSKGKQFIIRHRDKISTRKANNRAFKTITEAAMPTLRRRLEMVGMLPTINITI